MPWHSFIVPTCWHFTECIAPTLSWCTPCFTFSFLVITWPPLQVALMQCWMPRHHIPVKPMYSSTLDKMLCLWITFHHYIIVIFGIIRILRKMWASIPFIIDKSKPAERIRRTKCLSFLVMTFLSSSSSQEEVTPMVTNYLLYDRGTSFFGWMTWIWKSCTSIDRYNWALHDDMIFWENATIIAIERSSGIINMGQ